MARENGLTQWAITLLEAAQRAGGGDALADAHLSLLRGEAQSAADALIIIGDVAKNCNCLLYTSPSPRDVEESRMPSSA